MRTKLLTTLLLGLSTIAGASNVIHNGTFNTGVQGWKTINGGDCMNWIATDGNASKGAMQITNSTANPDAVWSVQIQGDFTTPLPAGNVTISYAIKCKEGTGTMRASIAGVGHYEADQTITTEFQTVTWSFTAKGGETGICFDMGAVANTYIIDDVKVIYTSANGSSSQCRPDLHVDGKYLKDPNGNVVNLHGVMDTPSMYFNSNRWSSWDLGGYVEAATPRAQAYFTKIFDAITDNSQGAYCDIFRLHMEPAWVRKDGVTSSGENDLATTYDRNKVKTYLEKLYLPIAQDAYAHGLYVIMRPPGVCPEKIQVNDDYQKYLMDVWDIVTQNETVKASAGWLSIELANEPVQVLDANGNRSTDGTWGPANGPAKTDFFQPIIDKIRANGFTGIIWVPGEGYQSSYQSYETYPIKDNNFGYAIHVYPGWYGNSDTNTSTESFISNVKSQVPGILTHPVAITECDWSPGTTDGEHYDGTATGTNYGTWGTARTSTWGNSLKGMMNYFGNVSLTLTSTDDYVDMTTYLSDGTVSPAFHDKADAAEACGKACFDWYEEWSKVDKPVCDAASSISMALTTSSELMMLPTTVTLTAAVNSEVNINNVTFYDGDDILGTVSASPYTLTLDTLSPGKHVIYAFATDEQTYQAYDSVIIDVHVPQAPYTGTAIVIPGTIDAENFDLGGEGYAYHDAEDENQGGAYRNEGVDIKSDETNGTRLGWTVKDEWMEYTVNIANAGKYNWTARVSTENDNAAFHMEIDDEAINESTKAVNTGAWDTYGEVSGTVELPAGEHILKVYIDESYFDLDYIKFEYVNPTGIATVLSNEGITTGEYNVYNVLGAKTGTVKIESVNDLNNIRAKRQITIIQSVANGKVYKLNPSMK